MEPGGNEVNRLPSLNALRTFEATVRLGSMSRAADELCVTPGAVSRQIQALEADLGLGLLHRFSRSVEPTAEGARLAGELKLAFNLIREGVAHLSSGPVVLSCSSSIMMRWLIPRLPGLAEAHPEVNLRLSASYGPIDMAREGVDLAIRNSVIPAAKDVLVRPLLREWIGPVCSPAYARTLGIRRPEDLARAALLATKTRPSAWRDWIGAADLALPALEPGNVLEHFYLLLQAAACGLGIAVSPRLLVEDDLTEGRLVAPFGFVAGNREVTLWTLPGERRRADVACVETWIESQFLRSARTG